MMSLAAISHHPLPASSPQIAPLERLALRDGSEPIKGEVSHPVWGEILRQSLPLHLPLDGGGREGVSASSMSSFEILAPGAAA